MMKLILLPAGAFLNDVGGKVYSDGLPRDSGGADLGGLGNCGHCVGAKPTPKSLIYHAFLHVCHAQYSLSYIPIMPTFPNVHAIFGHVMLSLDYIVII